MWIVELALVWIPNADVRRLRVTFALCTHSTSNAASCCLPARPVHATPPDVASLPRDNTRGVDAHQYVVRARPAILAPATSSATVRATRTHYNELWT
jgi:hypothetical protein